jgi:hypothetical protein
MNEGIERLKKWYEGRLKAYEAYIEELKRNTILAIRNISNNSWRSIFEHTLSNLAH